jgi:hypothetical protein
MNDIFRPLPLRGDWLMEIGGKEFSLPVLAAALLSEFIGLPLCFVGAETFGAGQERAGLTYWAIGLAFALFGLVLPFAGNKIQRTVTGWVLWSARHWRAFVICSFGLVLMFLAYEVWAIRDDQITYSLPRRLSSYQAGKISAILQSKPHNFTIGVVGIQGDEEGTQFAFQIYNAVKNGGWNMLPMSFYQRLAPLPPPPVIQAYAAKADFDKAIFDYVRNIEGRNAALLRQPPEPNNEGLCDAWIGTDPRPPTVADPGSPQTILEGAFSDAGVPITCGQGSGDQNSRDTFYILVGRRPVAVNRGQSWLWRLGDRLQQMSSQ